MSHQVTLKTDTFKDIESIRAAVALLNEKGGANITLIEGHDAKIRGWNGRTEKVDVALYMPNGKYDVGFNRKSDGTYQIRAEAYLGSGSSQSDLSPPRNAETADGEQCVLDPNIRTVGRLQSAYTAAEAMKAAASKGITTNCRFNEKGQAIVEAYVNA